MNKHIKEVEKLLKDTGLENESGSIIYSGDSTLRKGECYFLGQNPGGNAEVYAGDTILNQLLNSGEFNEYLEGYWTGYSGKLHQSNILMMFKDLNIDVEKTFSTNLSFIRSGNTEKYKRDLKDDYEIFWPIHEYFLSVVKPKTIICNGAQPKEFFWKKMNILSNSYDELFLDQLYRGRQMKCTSFSGTIKAKGEKLTLQILSIFHLSKWPYEDYKKGILWLKSKIGEQLCQ